MARTVKNKVPDSDKVFSFTKADILNVDRENALNALRMMKQLESERRDKLVEVRLDKRTVVCATPERIEVLKEEYKNNKTVWS